MSDHVRQLAVRARQTSQALAVSSEETRNQALEAIARAMEAQKEIFLF